MVSLAPEVLFHIGILPVTNTLINTLAIDGILLGTAYYISKHAKKVPGIFQNIVEMVVETFYNFTEEISGEKAKQIFPWGATFFLFILLANWSGLIPGFGTIGFFQGTGKNVQLIPLFRSGTSDTNVTFGLAFVSLIATHILAIRSTGIKEYLSRFFSFNPIFLFVGLLEIVSEITKLVSLSFRLFGNIFAGEVVLHTVSEIFAFLFPIPFLSLEIIVGLVQALVFSVLTMAFMSILMTPHNAEEH